MFIVALVIFILILSFLVLVHEFGHFIVAKRNRIHVEEFGIGFPPRLWSKKKGGTIYSVNTIPLGGFVKLLGEEEDVNQQNSFSKRSPKVRAKVILAGVIFNFVLAWLLLTIWFWVVPAHLANNVVIVQVEKNSPAALADIKPNDFIIKIDNIKINLAEDLGKFTSEHKGKEVTVTIKRFSREINKRIVLANADAALGVASTNTGGDMEKIKWYMAPLEALKEMAAIIVVSTVFIWKLIISLFGVGDAGIRDNVSGPVGIFAFLYQILSFGWLYILRFMALISLSLGFFNLLPLPALDGGRLLFIILEGIRGKKVIKSEFENALHWFGFILLLALMAIITYNDIMKWIIHK